MKQSESTLISTAARLWSTALGVSALLAVLGQAHADTYVSDNVGEETWTKANSPYRVNGNVQVNGPLTIQPGVRVLFQGNYTFQVQGQLLALGVANDPIVFTQTNGNSWQGIFFNYSGPAASQLIHCVISNAANSAIRIFNPTAIPQLRGCVLANNSGGSAGGLYAVVPAGDLTLSDCTFLNNSSGGSGGALWADMQAGNLSLTNCVFANNSSAYDGGGLYVAVHNKQLRLTNCVLQANVGYPSGSGYRNSFGGGLYVSGDSVLTDCLILSNYCRCYGVSSFTRSAQGGGVYSTGGDMVLTRCNFTGNRALNGSSAYTYAYGSGVYLVSGSLTASNSIFLANTCAAYYTPSGGGVYIDASPFQLVNCTFAYNGPEGLKCNSGTILNSIFYWNNSSGLQIAGNPTVTYSDVQNNPFAGTGDLNLPPLFQSATDLHLAGNSPCIDAGNPASALNDRCFPPSLGTVRNDMGAYGGPNVCSVPPCTSPTITSQSPGVVHSCPEHNVTLFVNASGTESLSYQWWFQNAPLPNQTANTLSLLNLTAAKAGTYWVVVTNGCGSVSSGPIQVAVDDFCVDIHMYAGLTVAGLPGTTAVLSYTTTPNNTNSWRPLATNTLSATPWFYLDMDSANSPHRFYRATLAP